MAKLENRYLREWVQYHHNLGFNHIYIYDNNEPDQEHCEDCLKGIKNFTIIDYRGKHQGSCQVQVQAYQHCYDTYGKNYDYMMFLDVDEFLVLKKHHTIQEYISEQVFKNVECIRISWVCYSDNDQLHYENRPVRERFTKMCNKPNLNVHFKYILKTNIPDVKITNVHYTSKLNTCCYNNGEIMEYTETANIRFNDDWAYIAHYITKSVEEYVEIKRKRRGPGGSFTRLNKLFFWKYNERTPEKEKILNELFK